MAMPSARDRAAASQYCFVSMQLFCGFVIVGTTAEPHNRQSFQEPRGVTPVRLFAVKQGACLPPV